MPLVSSGVEHGNLRELALARMKDMGTEVRLRPDMLCVSVFSGRKLMVFSSWDLIRQKGRRVDLEWRRRPTCKRANADCENNFPAVAAVGKMTD